MNLQKLTPTGLSDQPLITRVQKRLNRVSQSECDAILANTLGEVALPTLPPPDCNLDHMLLRGQILLPQVMLHERKRRQLIIPNQQLTSEETLSIMLSPLWPRRPWNVAAYNLGLATKIF